MGREAKPLFPVKFEEMVEKPIEELRKDSKYHSYQGGSELVSISQSKRCRTILVFKCIVMASIR